MPIIILFIAMTFCGFCHDVELHNFGYSVTWNVEHALPIRTKHILYYNHHTNNFRRHRFIRDQRVNNKDYPRGYDRGHMVPAGDMRWNEKIYKETFLTTNLSPQSPELNRGAWLELEKKIRRNIKPETHFEIITGALFNQTSIPIAYYKIIYNPMHNKSISYLLPNRACYKPLKSYQISLEKLISLAELTDHPPLSSDNPELFSVPTWRLIIFINGCFIVLLAKQSMKFKQY